MSDFECEYAEFGQKRCPEWRCDCFIDTYPDSPYGLRPAPSTLPAETREGREALAQQIEALPQFSRPFDTARYVRTDRAAALVRAASPAVSLPGTYRGPSPAANYMTTSEVHAIQSRNVLHMGAEADCSICHQPASAVTVSLPGEQPGGQELDRLLADDAEASENDPYAHERASAPSTRDVGEQR